MSRGPRDTWVVERGCVVGTGAEDGRPRSSGTRAKLLWHVGPGLRATWIQRNGMGGLGGREPETERVDALELASSIG